MKSYFQNGFLFMLSCLVFFAHAVDDKTLKILHLLKNKDYTVAVSLLEREMAHIKDKNKKGYYSFLLNQLPANIKMNKPRYAYAFIAGQYAQNIPRKKKMALWIEAGDGFF